MPLDPLEAQPHVLDNKTLLRLAALYNIPTTYNRTTADFLITSKLMNQSYDQTLYKNNLQRKCIDPREEVNL
jgi:methylglyoxal synthase